MPVNLNPLMNMPIFQFDKNYFPHVHNKSIELKMIYLLKLLVYFKLTQ